MRITIVRPVSFIENWLGTRRAIKGGAFSRTLDPATQLQNSGCESPRVDDAVSLAIQCV
jgi:hypothetical protein